MKSSILSLKDLPKRNVVLLPPSAPVKMIAVAAYTDNIQTLISRTLSRSVQLKDLTEKKDQSKILV